MAKIRLNDRQDYIIICCGTEAPALKENLFETEKDYNNEYAQVYFRINAPHYQFTRDYSCEPEEKEAYEAECRQLFKSWDISEKRFHNSCLEVERDKESLYLHPQSFSGVILKNSIKPLHDLLETAETFKLEGVDVYETYHDTDDETHLLNLDARKNEIRDDILREFKTKRRDLFCRIDRLKNVSSKYCAKRVKTTDGQNGGYGITYSYLLDLFSQLIEEKLIVCGMRKTETIYRTINRSEQKTLGITLHQIAE